MFGECDEKWPEFCHACLFFFFLFFFTTVIRGPYNRYCLRAYNSPTTPLSPFVKQTVLIAPRCREVRDGGQLKDALLSRCGSA